MPPLETQTLATDAGLVSRSELRIKSEATVIGLVRDCTNILTPKVHAIETRWDCQVKAPFMMMDCLPGNVGMDLGLAVPERVKSSFFKELARIHVSLLAPLAINDDPPISIAGFNFLPFFFCFSPKDIRAVPKQYVHSY